MTLTNNTLSGNLAVAGSTGGIEGVVSTGNFLPPILNLRNNISFGNQQSDVKGPATTLLSDGGNIFGVIDGAVGGYTGADLVGADPLLAPLADNGGGTDTFALQPGSPALGLGVTGGTTPAVDQRGFPRPAGGPIDAGAFQDQTPAPVAVADAVTTPAGQTLTVPPPGVLANDTSGIEGLSAILITPPATATGTLVFSSNGSFTFTPADGFFGTTTFTYAATNGVRTSAPATVSITVTPGTPTVPIVPVGAPSAIAAGTGAGVPSLIQTFAADGTPGAAFAPFESTFLGGVRVAVGDVTGDGVADIVATAGPGGGPRVVVFDGVTNAPIADFFAYEDTFRSGLFVAVGDVTRDGNPDIVTGTGSGGGPRVRVFSLDGTTAVPQYDFFAFEGTFSGGVRVAVGDVDGDGFAEIIATPGPTGGPRVAVFTATATDATEVGSFFALDENFRGGLFLAVTPGVGGVGGTIVVAPDNFPGAANAVVLGIDPTLAAANFQTPPGVYTFAVQIDSTGLTAGPVDVQFPYGVTFDEGIRVATYTTPEGSPGLVTAPGEGGGGLLRFFGVAGGVLTPDILAPVTAFDPAVLAFAPGQSSSVYVGASTDTTAA